MGIVQAKMKLWVLLATATLASAVAHWTHDESLAREIGPPPGEEDIDVATLSDELIQEKTGALRAYRVTIGTYYAKGAMESASDTGQGDGASNSEFTVELKGTHDNSAAYTSAIPIRYYQGPSLSYELAQKLAAPLHPGMEPLAMNINDVKCFPRCGGANAGGMPKIGSTVADADCKDLREQFPKCEANSKVCSNAIKKKMVCYAPGHPSVKTKGVEADAQETVVLGPIQRGQIKTVDVHAITKVQIKEKLACQLSSGCKCYDAYENGDLSQCSRPWKIAFAKINTNDPKTGIGNGVYYIKPKPGLWIGALVRKPCAKDEHGVCQPVSPEESVLVAAPRALGDEDFPEGSGYNAILTKCTAQVCEEEEDAKLGLESMKDY